MRKNTIIDMNDELTLRIFRMLSFPKTKTVGDVLRTLDLAPGRRKGVEDRIQFLKEQGFVKAVVKFLQTTSYCLTELGVQTQERLNEPSLAAPGSPRK